MKNITVTISGLLLLISICTKGQLPTATFTAVPNPVCTCTPVNFVDSTTNGVTLWKWYFPGGVPATYTTSIAPGYPPAVTYCNPGEYSISLIVSNGSGMDSVSNTLTVDSLPVIKIFPPSGGICDTSGGNSFDTVYFTVTASGNPTFSWSPPTGLSCTHCSNPIAFPAVTTVYTVTATSASGCISTATDTITVGNIIATIHGKDSICPGESDTLIASGGASNSGANTTYSWNNGSTTNEIIVSPSTTTTYSCIIESGSTSCESTGTFTVYSSCITGVRSITNQLGMEIHPNPATSNLSIQLINPLTNSFCLTISDITGREIYTQFFKATQQPRDIDISSLAKGMYFIEIKTQNSQIIKKFIKD